MRKPIPALLTLILALCMQPALAQSFINQWQGARSAALGNANAATIDGFSQLNNQAAAAFVDHYTVGVYGNRAFMVEGINNLSLSAVAPTGLGNFGLAIGYFGYSAYNEQKIGIGYSRQLSPGFSIGVQFDYLSSFISEYGTTATYTVEAGLFYKITDELAAGAHVFNPVLAGFAESADPLPTMMKLGLHYNSTGKVRFLVEAEKDLVQPVNFKAGVEYRPAEEISLRIGTSTNPVLLSIGAGFRWNNLLLDVASSYHPQLGITPHGGLVYSFQKAGE